MQIVSYISGLLKVYRANPKKHAWFFGLVSQANEGNGEIEYEGVHHGTGRKDL
jgi:hypothetical protein